VNTRISKAGFGCLLAVSMAMAPWACVDLETLKSVEELEFLGCDPDTNPCAAGFQCIQTGVDGTKSCVEEEQVEQRRTQLQAELDTQVTDAHEPALRDAGPTDVAPRGTDQIPGEVQEPTPDIVVESDVPVLTDTPLEDVLPISDVTLEDTPTEAPDTTDEEVAEEDIPCTPDCDSKVCGDDDCGGICGLGCTEGLSCTADGQCVEAGMTDNGDGTLTDGVTGLTWEQTAATDDMNVTDAEAYCEGLDLGGLAWRLPNISELRSLIRGCGNTVLDGVCGVTDICPECGTDATCLDMVEVTCYTQASCYDSCGEQDSPSVDGCYWDALLGTECAITWSSSALGDIQDYGWYVDFASGTLYNDSVTLVKSTRCVATAVPCTPQCDDKWCDEPDGCGGYCADQIQGCDGEDRCFAETESGALALMGEEDGCMAMVQYCDWTNNECGDIETAFGEALTCKDCGEFATCYQNACCTPDCGGKWCDEDDTCGGYCADHIEGCDGENRCFAETDDGTLAMMSEVDGCMPTDDYCDWTYNECGDIETAFGEGLICGNCDESTTCYQNQCCEADCQDKDCGDDICGGSCGLGCGDYGTCDTGSCVCTDEYTGVNCEISSSEACDGIDCGDHGDCVAGACVCKDGYFGAACEVGPTEACDGIDCGNYGTCEDGACVCTEGYTGEFCDTAPTDACDGVECGEHGSCEDGACVCTDEYTGEFCDTAPPDACDGIECGEHGDCVAGACTCKDGYFGTACELAPDLCQTVECGEHGSCAAGLCLCDDGYTGEFCDTAPTDACDGIECGDHGDCVAGACDCKDGYSGASCDTPPDPCATVNCGEHGNCAAGLCICTDGYSGANCDIAPADDCDGIDCGDYGTCKDGSCECTDGYTGEACETAPDLCAAVDCGEHGSCAAGLCICTDDYTGDGCETPPTDACDGIDCGMYGYCAAGLCICTDGYTGDNCETAMDPCALVDCADGSTCQDGQCVAEYMDMDDGTVFAPESQLLWMQCTMPADSIAGPWQDDGTPLSLGPANCPQAGLYSYCPHESNVCNGDLPETGDDLFDGGELEYGAYYDDSAWEACEKANAEQFAGHDDWRVPTLDELLSLSPLNPLFDLPEPAGSFPQQYWSTTSVTQTTAAYVDFSPGADPLSGDKSKQHWRHIRCVRADEICIPHCDAKTCGDDGCGGSCGACEGDTICNGGYCSEPGTACYGIPENPGCCEGTTWVYCADGVLNTFECGSLPMDCGWDGDSNSYTCTETARRFL
jgi:hypothetical protein